MDQLIVKGVVISQVLSAVLAIGALAVMIVMRTRLLKQPNLAIPYEDEVVKTDNATGDEVGENTTEDEDIPEEVVEENQISENAEENPQNEE